jgi:hypothetical protein
LAIKEHKLNLVRLSESDENRSYEYSWAGMWIDWRKPGNNNLDLFAAEFGGSGM